MDLSERPSAAGYRSLAVRWRQLAADATTPKARNHLLTLARQCEFLAGGTAAPAVAGDNREGAGLRDEQP